MKVVSALKKRCKDCKIIRKKKKIYVRCDTYPRHKQRQGFSTYTPLSTFVQIPEPVHFSISGPELLVLQSLCSSLIR